MNKEIVRWTGKKPATPQDAQEVAFLKKWVENDPEEAARILHAASAECAVLRQIVGDGLFIMRSLRMAGRLDELESTEEVHPIRWITRASEILVQE